MNKYKINIIYNEDGLDINEILIKTLKIEISRKFKTVILKKELLNNIYLSRGSEDR